MIQPLPHDLATKLAQAEQALRTHRFDEARRLCKIVLAKESRSTGALRILSAAELGLGNAPRAIQGLRRALQLSPADGAIVRELIGALDASESDDEAIAILEQASLGAPSSYDIYVALVGLYARTNKLESGIAFLKSAHQRNSQESLPLPFLSRLYQMRGMLEDAATYALASIALSPQSTFGRYQLAATRLFQKDIAGARDLLRECLLSTPESGNDRNALTDIFKDAEMILQIEPGLKKRDFASVQQNDFRDEAEKNMANAFRHQLGEPGQRHIVFFHVDWKGRHPFLAGGPAEVDYSNTLATACDAAARAAPDAAILLLTDKASRTDHLPAAVRVLRAEVDSAQMMYARMKAYRALAMTQTLAGPTLFLDTDVCLNRDFRELVTGDFDIGLTYRTGIGFWHMPVNEGLIIAPDGASPALTQFFGEALEIYDWLAEQEAIRARYGFDVRMWRGGQLSLGALLNWDTPPCAPDTLTLRQVRYRFFPADTYNYSVRPNDSFARLAGKWAVHFKGAQTKAMMTAYNQTAHQRRA